MRLNRTRKIEWRFHPQISHTILHDFEVDGDDTRHFNGATEGYFTISLGEVEISYGKFGPSYVDWEVDFATTA
jgi:hypothetical protein